MIAEKEMELKKRQLSAIRIREKEKEVEIKTARFKIDLQGTFSMSRMEDIDHLSKISVEDKIAVRKLEKIEVQALQKMQQTIKIEARHT